MKKINKEKNDKIRRIIILIGVLIIPLMYSYFYLGAFWDPYKTLDDIKVAVVNNDTGSNINGKDRNLGKELTKELKDNKELDFIITDEKEAKEGLLGNKYYASITIPKNFSTNISKLNSNDKQITEIIYSPNEKKNYLASQILNSAVNKIEKQTQEKITEEVVGTLTNEIKQTPIALGKIENGLNSLTLGSQKINNGSLTLLNGTNKLSLKYNEYNNSQEKINAGIKEYVNGAKKVNEGTKQIKEGTSKLVNETQKLNQIIDNTNNLASGLNTLSSGISSYTSNVNMLITNQEELVNLINLINNNPDMLKDANIQEKIKAINNLNFEPLKQAGTNINQNVLYFKNSTQPMLNNINKLTDLQNAIISLDNGTEKLSQGTSNLEQKGYILIKSSELMTNASNTVNDAITNVNNGVKTLSSGTESLVNGNITASTEVSSGKQEVNNKICELNNLDKFAAKTVEIKKKEVESVPNYGTSFAPYFMSLSLWIGAIIIFFGIYLDNEGSYKLLSRNSDKPLIRTISYFGIGILQALLLGFILQYALGLQINHPICYYLSIILASLVFISIVQFCMVTFKDLGKFLSILFLILQLTACGGTFPMETVPHFFNVLYPFMPMTYTVKLFKETISGVENMTMINDVIILIVIFTIFALLTIFCQKKKNKRVQN